MGNHVSSQFLVSSTYRHISHMPHNSEKPAVKMPFTRKYTAKINHIITHFSTLASCSPWVAGIAPGPKGAFSVALSGGYEDDVDVGEGL